MAREVDKSKTRKALRKLKRVAERASAPDAPELNPWERDFVDGVQKRLETFGSAFRDPAKGSLDEALSQRQTQVVRTLDKKTRPKSRADDAKPRKPLQAKAGFKRKSPTPRGRARDINEDITPEAPSEVEAAAPPEPALTPEARRAAMRVVSGGKSNG